MATRTEVGRSAGVTRPARGAKLGPGQAPPIGIENAKNARSNLERKLAVFRDWATYLVERDSSEGTTDQPPIQPLETLPRSQRRFNKWDSDKFTEASARRYGTFGTNSNTTLKKNNDLCNTLLVCLSIIAKASMSGRDERRRESVAALRRKLSTAVALRGVAEQELVRSRKELWQSRKQIERLTASVRSTEAKAKDQREDLQQQIETISAERAALARSLSKVTGLRQTRK